MRSIYYVSYLFIFLIFGCDDNPIQLGNEQRINIDPQGEMSISYPEGYIGKSFFDPQIPAWIFYIRSEDELVDIHYSFNMEFSSLPDTLKFYSSSWDSATQVFSNKVPFEFDNGFIGAIYHDNDNLDTTGFRNTFSKILLQTKSKDKFRLLIQANYNYRFQDEIINILKTIKHN